MNANMNGSSQYTVVSSLHQQYQVIPAGTGASHPSAKQVDFACFDSTHRFLRTEFSRSDSFWRGILRSHFPDVAASAASDLSGAPLYEIAAKLVSTQKIRIYKLPTLQGAITAKDGVGKAYRFVKGPDPLPSLEAKAVALENDQEIEQLLSKVKANDKFWASVLEESGTMPAGHNLDSYGHRETVKKLLKSGELRTYELPYTPAAPKSEGELVLETIGPGSRTAPLAPENSTGYIELKLLYDDDTPVANQDYWIRDCEGNEYTGKTDDKGIAKVASLPTGNCEISFPELDGWYQ